MNRGFSGSRREADAAFRAKGTAWTSQKHGGPQKRAVLSSNRVTGRPDYLLAPALARPARHSRNSRYRGSRSCGTSAAAGATTGGGGAAPDAADTAEPAGSGMLRSSH